MGWALDAPSPDSLVKFGVQPHIGGAHRLSCKGDDGLDGVGCALLEGAAMDAFVEMDGVFAGHDILEGRASLAAAGGLFGGGLSERMRCERNVVHDEQRTICKLPL